MTESPTVLFLMKLTPLLVMPLGLAMVLLVIGAVASGRRWLRFAGLARTSGMALLWITATPAFADWACGTLESRYPPKRMEDIPTADVIVVLGGAVGQPLSPRVTTDLVASSDRVLHAARLWHAGKAKRIMVTGGNLPWLPAARPEAELISDLLVEWGVPADAIETAGASRTTYENALEIRAMRTPFKSALLVTSAVHMPRALAVFSKAGLPVIPATTDVMVVTGEDWTILRWLPDANALALTTSAAKEWIGFWAYRALGHL